MKCSAIVGTPFCSYFFPIWLSAVFFVEKKIYVNYKKRGNIMAYPSISVIVPVYNTEIYLKRCIDSIINQTFKDIEIILIDDGSTDSSADICDQYAQLDSRIRVVHQMNKGVSTARNVGLDLARGDYIGFVDSDDFIAPTMFETLLNLILKYQVPISMCSYLDGHNLKYCESLSPAKIAVSSGVLSAEDALRKILVPGDYNGFLWNKLFDSRLFNGENPIRMDCAIFFGEDLLTVVQCMTMVSKIAYTTQPYYFYRIRQESLSSCLSSKSLTLFLAQKKILSLLPPSLIDVAKASCAMSASIFLCKAYAMDDKTYIPYLRKIRRKYLGSFWRERKCFSLKDEVRMWGTGIWAPLFCRIWNKVKAMQRKS
jgi:glycosyltransferase involved in cell wall biosynthesis